MTNYTFADVEDYVEIGSGDYVKVLDVYGKDPDQPLLFQMTGQDSLLHNYGTLYGGALGAGLEIDGAGHRVVNFAGAWIGGTVGIDYSGSHGQIVNYGTIFFGSEGVLFHDAISSVFDNRGSIYRSGDGVALSGENVDVTIRNSGIIESYIGMSIEGQTEGVRLSNSGTIDSDQTGIAVAAGSNDVEIYNSGLVTGLVGIRSHASGRVINEGSISARNAIVNLNEDTEFVVINHGAIYGDISIRSQDFAATNTGTIGGTMFLSLGNDLVRNSGDLGVVHLYSGNDRYIATGMGTAKEVNGGKGNDILKSADAATVLNGGSGQDKIYTGAGGGTLHGGAGRDLLFGGDGADVFLFDDVADSAAAQPDVIIGFERGVDVINLAGVAAMPLAFDGTDALRGGGQASVNYVQRADGHLNVWVDANGDGSRDMRIVVKDTDALDWDDFGLDPLIV